MADLKTDTKPADKKIKITFKIEAIDKDKFNTPEATITEEIHLIKVKDIDNDYIIKTLQNDTIHKPFVEGITDESQLLQYEIKNGKDGGNALEFKPSDNSLTTDFSKSKLKRKVIAEIDKVLKPAGIEKTEASDDNVSLSGKDISFKVKFSYGANYDGSQITNPMEVILKAGGNTWTE